LIKTGGVITERLLENAGQAREDSTREVEERERN